MGGRVGNVLIDHLPLAIEYLNNNTPPKLGNKSKLHNYKEIMSPYWF